MAKRSRRLNSRHSAPFGCLLLRCRTSRYHLETLGYRGALWPKATPRDTNQRPCAPFKRVRVNFSLDQSPLHNVQDMRHSDGFILNRETNQRKKYPRNREVRLQPQNTKRFCFKSAGMCTTHYTAKSVFSLRQAFHASSNTFQDNCSSIVNYITISVYSTSPFTKHFSRDAAHSPPQRPPSEAFPLSFGKTTGRAVLDGKDGIHPSPEYLANRLGRFSHDTPICPIRVSYRVLPVSREL